MASSKKYYDNRGKKTGSSSKQQSMFGGSKRVYYDNRGKKTGSSSKEPSMFGGSKTVYRANNGRKTGSSSNEPSLFGGSKHVRRDNQGRKTGSSSNEPTWLGGSRTVYRDSRGRKTGSSTGYASSGGSSGGGAVGGGGGVVVVLGALVAVALLVGGLAAGVRWIAGGHSTNVSTRRSETEVYPTESNPTASTLPPNSVVPATGPPAATQPPSQPAPTAPPTTLAPPRTVPPVTAPPTTAPPRSVTLDQLRLLHGGSYWGPATIDGNDYNPAYVTDTPNCHFDPGGMGQWALDGQFQRFDALIGVTDSSLPDLNGIWKVYVDAQQVANGEVVKGQPQGIHLSVAGAQTVTLKIWTTYCGGLGGTTGYIALADPTVSR